MPYNSIEKRRANDLKNRDRILKYRREYYHKNKDIISKQNDNYRERNKEKVVKIRKLYAQKNFDKIAKYKKEYAIKNKKKLNEYNRIYRNKRRVIDLQFNLKEILRTRLNHSLRGKYKSGSSIKDIGCTVEQLIIHIESQFKQDMSWKNRKEWHIDHIKPLSKFDLTNREEFLQAVHYTNLQPLWALENRKKSNK